jgi:hypothetical protein
MRAGGSKAGRTEDDIDFFALFAGIGPSFRIHRSVSISLRTQLYSVSGLGTSQCRLNSDVPSIIHAASIP